MHTVLRELAELWTTHRMMRDSKSTREHRRGHSAATTHCSPPAGDTRAPLAGRDRGSAEPSEEATSGAIYQQTFVGREAELKQLQAAFDGALSGQGALVMVVGEPGIGKTTVTEQLLTYIAMRGGRTLVGHCYEEGSL